MQRLSAQALEGEQLAHQVQLDVGHAEPVQQAIALGQLERPAPAGGPELWVAGGHGVEMGVEQERGLEPETGAPTDQVVLSLAVAQLVLEACLKTGRAAEWQQEVDERPVRDTGTGVDCDDVARDR